MAIIEVPEHQRPLRPEPGQPPERFAIATTETPLALFQEFDPTHAARRKEEYKKLPETDPKTPADVLSYFDAARFCNWLSEREHIPPDQWCYRPGKEEGTMVLAPDYLKLPRISAADCTGMGIRRPRGTTTDRYFGQNLAFVADYAWYNANSGFHTQPIGRLRPNDFGLFDMFGNVSEWCRNPKPVPHPKCESCPPGKEPDPPYMRLESHKGNHFARNALDQAIRADSSRPPGVYQPEARFTYSGFRVVKNEF